MFKHPWIHQAEENQNHRDRAYFLARGMGNDEAL
jgi:hypothetical protein